MAVTRKFRQDGLVPRRRLAGAVHLDVDLGELAQVVRRRDEEGVGGAAAEGALAVRVVEVVELRVVRVAAEADRHRRLRAGAAHVRRLHRQLVPDRVLGVERGDRRVALPHRLQLVHVLHAELLGQRAQRTHLLRLHLRQVAAVHVLLQPPRVVVPRLAQVVRLVPQRLILVAHLLLALEPARDDVRLENYAGGERGEHHPHQEVEDDEVAAVEDVVDRVAVGVLVRPQHLQGEP